MLKDYFLNKIKEKYPENFSKYDYSLLPNEFRSVDKLPIECLIHGVFRQIATVHICGKGCPKCGTVRRIQLSTLSTEKFIIKANNVHNNFYIYPRTDYTGNKNKVIITCPIHGDFLQTPNNHLTGQSCPRCSRDSLSFTTEEFIKKAVDIHGNDYTYPRTKYTGSNNKVIINCPIHGAFEQKAASHLEGKKCKKCSNNLLSINTRSTLKEFIRKARLIHDDKYDYSKVIYVNKRTKIIIVCPTHGEFLQTPEGHLNSRGCYRCSESHGEKHISTILNKYNIRYIREYKIPEYRYKYDFYLPDYDIYIEYHGEQHYKENKFFGGKKALKYIQRNDKTKIELIKRFNSLLIVIKHTFKTQEQIEDELLRLFSIIHSQFLINKETVKQAIIDSNIYLIENGISYKRKK